MEVGSVTRDVVLQVDDVDERNNGMAQRTGCDRTGLCREND